MPYIIIINMPGYLPEHDPYAVATLEEAREAAEYETGHHFDTDSVSETPEEFAAIEAAKELPESGGVIGPLPTGYVIDVQPVSWAELASRANLVITADEAMRANVQETVIDAYNA